MLTNVSDPCVPGLVAGFSASPIYMAYAGKVPREKLQDASPDDQKTLRGIAVSVICPALDVRAFLADMMVLSLTALLRH